MLQGPWLPFEVTVKYFAVKNVKIITLILHYIDTVVITRQYKKKLAAV